MTSMVAERRVDEGAPQGLGLGDVGREYPDGVGWTDLYRLMNQEDPIEINPMFGVQDINIRTILKRTNSLAAFSMFRLLNIRFSHKRLRRSIPNLSAAWKISMAFSKVISV